MLDQSKDQKPPRILIVEDEAIVAEDLGLFLENHGYVVTGKAYTGEEAIHSAEKSKPDLILMDIKLKGKIDGIEAANRIRTRLDIPVVYLTAYGERDVLERAKLSEPYGYVTKPFSFPELRSTIETAIHKHGADRRVRESEARRAKAEQLAGLHGWEWDLEKGHLIWSESLHALGLHAKDPEQNFDIFISSVHPDDRDLVRIALNEALEGNHPYDLEFRLIQPDGQVRFVHSRGEVERNDSGQAIRMNGMALDITDRKRAEEALKTSEEKYRFLTDNMTDVIWTANTVPQLTYASPSISRLLGYTPEEFVKMSFAEFLTPESYQLANSIFRERGKLGSTDENSSEIRTTVVECRHKNGSIVPVELVARSLYDQLGNFSGILGVSRDITERKKAEEELRGSEERFRSLIEQASDAIFVHDFEGKFLEVNQQACISLGYSRQELLSMSVSDIDPAIMSRGDYSRFWLSLPATFETKHHRKDGTTFPVEIRLGPIEYAKTKVILALARDITERSKGERVLETNDERFRIVFQTSPDAICINRVRDGVYVDVNVKFSELSGYAREEVIGKSSLQIKIWNNPEDRDRLIHEVQEFGSVNNIEFEFRRKDGTLRTGLISARLTDIDGEPHVLSVTRDVEDSKKDRIQLREKTLVLKSLIETLPDSVYFKDLNRRHILVNKAYSRFWGVSEQEIIGKTIEEFVASDNIEQSSKSDKNVIETGIPYKAEHSWPNEKGDIHIFETRKFPIRDENGTIVAVGGISRDITEQKLSTEALRHHQEELQTILDSVPAWIFYKDSQNHILNANKTCLNTMGLSLQDVVGKSLEDFLPKEQAEEFYHDDIHVITSGKAKRGIIEKIKIQGKTRWFITDKVPYLDPDGSIIGVIVFALDITDRKKAEDELIRREALIRSVSDNFPSGMLYQALAGMDGSRKFTYLSKAVRHFYGCSPEEAMNNPELIYGKVFHEDRDRLVVEEQKAIETLSPFQIEIRMINPSGDIRWSYFASGPTPLEDGTIRWSGIEVDITQRKKMEQQLEAALKEKEVLLREIHHRIKNNLAVVNSLVSLQSRGVKDEYHREMLVQIQDRIRSMALAHEKLYESENLSQINIRDYLRSLCKHLKAGLGNIGTDVRVQEEIAEVDLELGIGITVGFVVTELLTNCYKHAFPSKMSGKISIKLKEIDESLLELSVADNGVGLPNDIELDESRIRGLSLVRIFCRQLNGDLEMRRNNGTEIILKFNRLQ